MTPDEIINLLTVAASYDNRKPGEANVTAWVESSNRGRWTFPEAIDAVADYYTTTTDTKPWIMPSHITTRIRATRQDTAMRRQTEELASNPPHPRVARMIESVAAKFAIPEQFKPTSMSHALQVRCPHCDATEGQPCTRPSRGGVRERSPHPSRLELAEEPV